MNSSTRFVALGDVDEATGDGGDSVTGVAMTLRVDRELEYGRVIESVSADRIVMVAEEGGYCG